MFDVESQLPSVKLIRGEDGQFFGGRNVQVFTRVMASNGKRSERGIFALAGLWQRLFLAANYAFQLILAFAPVSGK